MATQNFQLIHWDGTKQKRVESQTMELKLGKLAIGSLADIREVGGKLDIGGAIITNVGAPADASDLTSKSYVDSTAATVASAAVAPTQADLDTLEASFAQELLDRASGDASTLSSAQAYADQKVADLVNSAPAVLDTLKELSDALGGDANFATTITNSIAAVQAEVDAEETRAIAADAAHDSRLDAIEENLETQITTVFEDTAAVYADGFPGTQDASFREGWYFKNLVKGNKINWYFFDGMTESATVASFGAYAVVTFDSVVSKPHLAFYTKPTGSGDVGGWYKSRKVFVASGSPVVGVKYLMYFGTEPEVHPELPRLTMTVAENSVGPLAPSEEIMTAVFGSDSNSNANNVQFVCESVGVNDSNIKRKLQLKIRKASEAALQAEISRAQSAEAALQSSVSANASAISAETTRATNAEASLTASLNALSLTVSSLSSGSAADIAAEEARALAAEAALQGEVDAVEADLAQEVLDRAAAVSAEQARAEAAELALQGEVDAVESGLAQELLDRAAADTALQGSIDTVAGGLAQELLDRAAADTALQGEIDAVEADLAQELLDRAAAVAVVQAEVDAEEVRAAAAELALQGEIDAEETRALAAEAAIQAEVDAEELARAAADAALQAEIDAEESRAIAAESELQDEIDALEVVVSELNIISKTADAAISAGKVCYIKSNGNIDLADADLDMSDSALIISAASIASGASGKVVIKEGAIVGGFSGLVPGKKCFVSKTAGEVVQSLAGFESGNSVYCVGRAISATEIAFQPVYEFEY